MKIQLQFIRYAPLAILLAEVACGSIETEFQKCRKDGLCGEVLKVGLVSGEFPDSPNHPAWQSEAFSTTTQLEPQLITNPQWPNPAVKHVSVAALRSNSEIAIRLEWEDHSNELESSYSDNYIDKAAVMFPLKAEVPPITMGAEEHPVNIWHRWCRKNTNCSD